ncbi:unnamed protein product [Schistosoma margrebowiei]|uniref:HMG box domain-containing protein n=1 Tax=Schistosoma margrebowiei TaxID=48269 RepID=A0AA85AQK2_9TREM|nr:unnamed protein product [Schistosoma margrebowiei]
MASKKCMPLITNYKSDDSSLDDDDADCDDIFNSLTENSPNNALDEDDQPLSNFRPLHSSQNDFLKRLTVMQPSTNDSSIGSFKQQLTSTEDSILPNISDSEDSDSFSSSTDEEFKKLVDTSSSLPVTELLRSKQFTLMYSDKNYQKGKSDRIINIGYSQFFQEIQSAIKYEQPNASFHDICQLVDERWNQLSKIEKKEYKKHSVVSMESQKMTSLSKCRSKLLSLLSEDNKQCCNPTCKNPVSYDPRWNGQYCSTKCVGEHCQLTFIDWCNNKRFDGKILNDTLYTVQRIPVMSPIETNMISIKSSTHKNDNTVINTSINITTITTATTTTTSSSSSSTDSNNNRDIMIDSSDCVSVSLKRKPLFESLRSEQFNTQTVLIRSSNTSSSSSTGPTSNLTLSL